MEGAKILLRGGVKESRRRRMKQNDGTVELLQVNNGAK